MIIKNEKSNLPYSFEEVDQLSLQTYNLMQRDLAQFNALGIDQSEMDSFKALSDSFNKRDFDEQYVLKQKIKTQAKEVLVKEIRTDVYDLLTVVNWAWQGKSIGFKILNLGSLSKETDTDLATKAKVCISVLSENIADFASVGITLESLDALSIKIDNLRYLIDEQMFAMEQRRIAQSKRVGLANNLYSEMMKYRNLGRKMWITKDYELSQSYVMPKKYSGSGGSDPEPEEEVVTDNNSSESNGELPNV